MDRKLALVTGASAGIGAAFARILASHGYDLALTARRTDRLEALAEEIRLRFGVETLTVDAVINNAGYGLPGGYATTRWADQAAFIQVMVTAPCELAHRVAPGMVQRR